MINEPPPLKRDYKKDPDIKGIKGGGLLIMGLHYVFQSSVSGSWSLGQKFQCITSPELGVEDFEAFVGSVLPYTLNPKPIQVTPTMVVATIFTNGPSRAPTAGVNSAAFAADSTAEDSDDSAECMVP